jgi:hypothetical protein
MEMALQKGERQEPLGMAKRCFRADLEECLKNLVLVKDRGASLATIKHMITASAHNHCVTCGAWMVFPWQTDNVAFLAMFFPFVTAGRSLGGRPRKPITGHLSAKPPDLTPGRRLSWGNRLSYVRVELFTPSVGRSYSP